MSGRSHW
nr:unnamed protein product [Callosobruchus analis]